MNSSCTGALNPLRGAWKQSILGPIVLALLLSACGDPDGTVVESTPETLRPETPQTEELVAPPSIDVSLLQRASLVVITLDTTRADHLEPYAAEAGVETPHLKKISRQGVVFEEAWATAPVTLPTHASLFTGLNPPRHAVRNNGIHYLSPEKYTLAEMLSDQGFETAAFISAAVLDHRYGLDQGFALYDDDLSAGGPKKRRLNAERPASETVAAASRWLDQRSDTERFFLWVHLFDPHAPYEPPSPWDERFASRPYAGEIAAVDAAIGRLLDHPQLLDRQRFLLVVVGDHGESLGEHGESTHAMLAYDATLRIPWIMRLPAGGDGSRISQPVSQIDLVPTVLDLLIPEANHGGEEIEGLSLRAALTSDDDPALSQRALYAETLVPFYTYGWSPLRSVRRQGLKYIEAPQPELYDLTRDPGEIDNLLSHGTPEPLDLMASLGQFEKELPESSSSPELDADMIAKLRSLGYLGTRVAPQRGERPDPKAVIGLHEKLEKAQHVFLRRDFETTIELLRPVLRQDAENLVALTTLARALVAVDQPEKAREMATRALTLDPENPDLLVTSGLIELSQGRPSVALQAFEAALALDPRWLDAAIERVRVLFQLGRLEEGNVALAALLRDEPENTRAIVARAEWVELPAGDLGPAQSSLRVVTEKQPSLGEAWRVLGRVLEADGRASEALDVYRQGLVHLPRDGALQARLGVLLTRVGKPDEAETHLLAALEQGQQGSETVHYALATVAQQRQDWVASESSARRAVEISPAMSSGWNLLAAALEEQGRMDEALDAYQRARSSDPANWQALFNQALLMNRLQRFPEARDLFEDVLVKQPEHAKTHFQLGALYAGVFGDTTRARQHLEASLAAEDDARTADQIRRLLAQLP